MPILYIKSMKKSVYVLYALFAVCVLFSCAIESDAMLEAGLGDSNPAKLSKPDNFTEAAPVSAGARPANFNDDPGYWHDGDVLVYQKATAGNGIDIFIIGDCFIWADLKKGGRWEHEAKKYAYAFLDCEVIRNFRKYFNVKILFSESSRRYVNGGGTDGSGAKFGSSSSGTATFNENAMRNAVAPHVKNKNETYLMVLAYSLDGANQLGGWARGSLAAGSVFDNEVNTIPWYWVRHEFVGHAFAKLADEYSSGGNTRHPQYDTDHQHGWDLSYFNGDAQSLNIAGWPLHNPADKNDPYIKNKLPPWKDFLGRPEYAREHLGAYEGGGGATQGRWHATPNLCYMNTSRDAGFCVICRYTIWLNIQVLGVESGARSFEDRLRKYQDENKDNGDYWWNFKYRWPTAYARTVFLAYDKVNLR